MVSNINGCVDVFELNEIALDPFTKRKILDINVARTHRGLLGVAHCHATVVVLVCDGGCFLRDVQVPKDTPNKEGHLLDITGSHEFCFGCRKGHGGLKLCFIGNRTAR